MDRTEKTTEGKGRTQTTESALSGFDGLGRFAERSVAIITVCTWLGSLLAGLFRSPLAIDLLADAGLLLAALVHLHAVDARLSRRHYTEIPRLERLARADLRFAWRWIAFSLALLVGALTIGPELPLGVTGVVGGFLIYLNGVVIGVDVARAEAELLPSRERGCRAQPTPLLPGTAWFAHRLGRRRALGRIGRRLAIQMAVVACTVAAFVGLSIAAAIPHGEKRDRGPVEKRRAGGDTAGGGSAGSPLPEDGATPEPEPEELTYAELCPALRNPLAIGHGLGELFRRAGAVKAGCGKREEAEIGVAGVFVAEGICSGRLRSLAVSSPDYSPVLLYGEAATFAQEAAETGQLLFVDGAEPGSGEVDVIGTTAGNYVFARSSPYLRGTDEGARRCSEVRGTARPFAELVPPAAELWLQHVELLGWAWPVERSGEGGDEIVLVGWETGTEVARTRCDGGRCRLDGIETGEHREYSGIAYVRLPELAPFMPPYVE
jgi:hypothetical protein